MADAGGQEQLGFAWAVDDQASGPMGQIEKSYLNLMKTMDVVMRQTSKAMKSFNDRTEDVAEAADDAGDSIKKQKGKFGELDDALKRNWLGLDRLGVSWDKFIKLAAAVSVGAAVAGILGFLAKAAQRANEFEKAISRLTEAYAGNARETRQISNAILSLQGRAGATRDEVVSMTRAMLDIGLVPKEVEKTGMSFKDLAAATLDLNAATGLGSEQSAAFVDQLIRINRVPPTNIRGIGAAIKSVADNSKITTDELVAFNKSLEPLLAQLGLGGEDATQFTAEMAAVAGVLSDAGISAEKVTSKFGDMLDETSESGNIAAGQLANFANIGVDSLRQLIAEDPSKLFDLIAKRAGELDPTQLKLYAQALEEAGTGFGRTELFQLRRFAQESQQSFQDRAKLALEESKRQKRLQDIAARRQSRLEAILSSFQRMWDTMMIQIGGAVLKNVLPPLRKHLFPMLERLTKFIRTMDWDKAIGTAVQAIEDVITAVRNVVESFGGWKNILLVVGAIMSVKTLAAVSQLAGGFLTLSKNVGKAGFSLGDKFLGALKAVGPMLVSFAAKAKAVIATMAAGSAPFLAIAGAIGSVAFAVRQLSKIWDELDISEVFKGISETFKEGGFVSTLGQLFDPTALIKNVKEDIGSLFGENPTVIERRAEQTRDVARALAPAQGTAGAPGAGAVVNVPTPRSEMRAPTLETIANRQLRLQERQLGVMEDLARRRGPLANLKQDLLLSNAGA
ncbi:MAG: phage tail tape measure protein [Gammaproteobacteria bacterium]|nr:phage tail tape measure protein [Gammaproteobacteria bacterium]